MADPRAKRTRWRCIVPFLVIISSMLFTLQLTGALSSVKVGPKLWLGRKEEVGRTERVDGTVKIVLAELAMVKKDLNLCVGNAKNSENSGELGDQAMRQKAEAAYGRMMERRSKFFKMNFPKNENEAYFYYAPMYNCMGEERVGTITDGGKWICDPTSLNRTSVVYSVGSNGDTAFEEDLHSLCNNCQIHTFDMTLTDAKEARVRKAEAAGILKFHNYGLGTKLNETARIKPLKQIMAELGHKYIDIFKVDCEGCEWEFFNDLLNSPTPIPFGQILVEVHPYFHAQHVKVFNGLESQGYRLFHYEVNPYVRTRMIVEVSFVHERLVKPLRSTTV